MSIGGWIIGTILILIVEYIREASLYTAIWHTIFEISLMGIIIVLIRWDLNREGW